MRFFWVKWKWGSRGEEKGTWGIRMVNLEVGWNSQESNERDTLIEWVIIRLGRNLLPRKLTAVHKDDLQL